MGSVCVAMATMRSTPSIVALAIAVSALAACSKSAPASPAAPSPVVSPPAAQTFTITGHVVDPVGNPVADGSAVVTAGPVIGARSDIHAGAFTLTGLPAGTYTIAVSGTLYDPKSVTTSIKGDASVTVVMTGNLNFDLSGVVTRADSSAPLAGLVVYMDGWYTAVTDASGHYQMKAELDGGPLASLGNYVFTSADGLDFDVRYIRSSAQNLRLYPTRHIEIGTPAQVTVTPNDGVCNNNTQEIGYGDIGYVCRIVHATASSDGALTVEVVSDAGDHFPLVVQTQGHTCCDLKLKNPEVFNVVAGADVTIFVELPESAPGSQTFTVKTALANSR